MLTIFRVVWPCLTLAKHGWPLWLLTTYAHLVLCNWLCSTIYYYGWSCLNTSTRLSSWLTPLNMVEHGSHWFYLLGCNIIFLSNCNDVWCSSHYDVIFSTSDSNKICCSSHSNIVFFHRIAMTLVFYHIMTFFIVHYIATTFIINHIDIIYCLAHCNIFCYSLYYYYSYYSLT